MVCLNDDLLVAGAPFMLANDISVRPSRHVITFSDRSVFVYGSELVLQIIVVPGSVSRKTELMFALISML